MSAHGAADDEPHSPPASPPLSDVLSLPDVASDLANLSDISSLSDDEEHEFPPSSSSSAPSSISPSLPQSDLSPGRLAGRRRVSGIASEQDPDGEEDEDYTEVTRSMTSSSFIAVEDDEDNKAEAESAMASLVSSARNNTASTQVEHTPRRSDRDRTPSASVSYLSSPLRYSSMTSSRTSEITVNDLAYPDPRSDGSSPFGSRADLANEEVLPSADNLETSIIMDDYSMLASTYAEDSKPESEQSPSLHREQNAVEQDSTSTADAALISDVTDTSVRLGEKAAAQRLLEKHDIKLAPAPVELDADSSPFLASAPVVPAEPDITEAPRNGAAATSHPVMANRRAPRWHPGVLACGLLGVAIAMGGVVYQGDAWRPTFPNTTAPQATSVISVASATVPSPVQLIEGVRGVIATLAAVVENHTQRFNEAPPSSAPDALSATPVISTYTPTKKRKHQAEPQDSEPRDSVIHLPPAVSALSSVASLGLSALSTHVSTALSFANVHKHCKDVILMEDTRSKHKTSLSVWENPNGCHRDTTRSGNRSKASHDLTARSQHSLEGDSLLSHATYYSLTTREIRSLKRELRGRKSKSSRKAKKLAQTVKEGVLRSYTSLRGSEAGLAFPPQPLAAIRQARAGCRCSGRDGKSDRCNCSCACKCLRNGKSAARRYRQQAFETLKTQWIAATDLQHKRTAERTEERGQQNPSRSHYNIDQQVRAYMVSSRQYLRSLDIETLQTWISEIYLNCVQALFQHLGIQPSHAHESTIMMKVGRSSTKVIAEEARVMLDYARAWTAKELAILRRNLDQASRKHRKSARQRLHKARKASRRLIKNIYRI